MKNCPKFAPTPWDGLVLGGIVALALACSAWLAPSSVGSLQGVVSVAGTEIATLSLDSGDGVYEYEGNGYHVEVTLSQGEIWVSHADCPTQDCVHTGHIHRPGQSIVCLPAQMSVRLVGGEASSSGVDVVVG